jgi:hypothetical protein
MTEGQEVLEIIRLSAEGRPTDSFSTDTYDSIFSFGHWVIFFVMFFLPKLPADRRGPQFEKHQIEIPYLLVYCPHFILPNFTLKNMGGGFTRNINVISP